MGAFEVTRGLIEAPDEVGEALGWVPVDDREAAVNRRPTPALRRHVGSAVYASH